MAVMKLQTLLHKKPNRLSLRHEKVSRNFSRLIVGRKPMDSATSFMGRKFFERAPRHKKSPLSFHLLFRLLEISQPTTQVL